MPVNTLFSSTKDLAGVSPNWRIDLHHRILVADDDHWICSFNAELLVQHGFYVDTAKNGAIAWAAVQRNKNKYDLLITDNKMPKLSGLELVRKIHNACIPLPAIMASGAVPTDELDRNQWFNIEAVLHKPYTAERLLETVRNVLIMNGTELST